MESVDEFAEFVDGSVILVNLGVVEGIVAVIAVMGKIVYRARPGHPSVNLLIDVGHPYDIDAEVGEITLAGFLQHALEVAAVECGGIQPFASVVDNSAIVDVVGRVAVAETVGDDKINGRAVPVKIGLPVCG